VTDLQAELPEQPQLEDREGTIFGLHDMPLLFSDRDSGIGEIWDEEHPSVPELLQILRNSKAGALFAGLSYPIRNSPWQIAGGKLPDKDIHQLHEDMEQMKIGEVLAQMCLAFVVRRTYHEKVWHLRKGRYVPSVEWRPPADCVLLRDIRSGVSEGFKQSALIATSGSQLPTGDADGWYRIRKQYAVTHIHHKDRDPVKGMSDFDHVWWCMTQKQKLWFLWFQYLEGSALPRTVVHSRDAEMGKKAVRVLASLKNSGVAAIPEGWFREIQLLDVSGKGAAEFQDALTALDQEAADSVLEGFMTLANAAAQNAVGSYALSSDLSDFFLQSLTYAAEEIATTITEQILRDMVAYNYPKLEREDYPRFEIGPISEKDATPTLELFSRIATATRGSTSVPPSFMEQLVLATSRILDMDEGPIAEDLEQWRAQEDAAQKLAAQGGGAPSQQPGAPLSAELPNPPGVASPGGTPRSVTQPNMPITNPPAARKGLRVPMRK